jgi:cobalt-zinc-cadmium efflux system membrane fusion protein
MTILKRSATICFFFFAIVITPCLAQSQDNQPKTHNHETASETCFICDKALRDKGRLWCKEHARYEDRCWICHPDLEEKGRAYCAEHSLYEDECFICDPDIMKSEGVKNSAKSCLAHGVHEDLCFICDKALRDKGRLWCIEHARYEDRCWICHPEMKDSTRPFCSEHHLYEDECFICNPKLKKLPIKEGKKAARTTIFCTEHQVAEEECGICQPQLASELEVGKGMKVRFQSKESASMAGVKTSTPESASSAPTVEAFCQINYNENAVALVTPILSGIVQKVHVNLGMNVEAGQILAEIHSIDISRAKTGYLSAIADVDLTKEAYLREKSLVDQKISSMREYQEAFAAYQKAQFEKNTAHQRLLNYGFNEDSIVNIQETKDRSSTLRVRAPFKGTVISRKAVMGEAIKPGQSLFTVADLSTMWLELKLPSDKVPLISNGMNVEATFSNLPGFLAQGHLAWVDSEVDPSSRMIKALAIIKNTGQLKKGMFGTAKIALSKPENAFHIAKDAVQRHENKTFVFVKLDEDLFDLRRVTLGNLNGKTIDVVAGIESNEEIVVAGTFTVMSEFLKSRLGAGCVDD